MYTYVWGALVAAFLIDIIKLNYKHVGNHEENLYHENRKQVQTEPSMIVKLDDEKELKVTFDHDINTMKNDKLIISFLYW